MKEYGIFLYYFLFGGRGKAGRGGILNVFILDGFIHNNGVCMLPVKFLYNFNLLNLIRKTYSLLKYEKQSVNIL